MLCATVLLSTLIHKGLFSTFDKCHVISCYLCLLALNLPLDWHQVTIVKGPTLEPITPQLWLLQM